VPAQPTKEARPSGVSSSVGGRTVYNRSLANILDGPVEWRTKKALYTARIERGEIVLDDGRCFESPTAACEAVAGGSHNGWRMWRRDGKTIAELHP